MTQPVLVLNLGSSSIKYALFEGGKRRLSGLLDKVGMKDARLVLTSEKGQLEREVRAEDHQAGLKYVFDMLTDSSLGELDRIDQLYAVGHRTVHGGTRFTEPAVIDENVKQELRRIIKLAPLHNPINLLGIEICEELLPSTIPNVAVFDTSFHMTMPEYAYCYALPRKFAAEHGLRRFGFHGTSHHYVSKAACVFLGKEVGEQRLISCHLGNGASVAAVKYGRSVDTSMGLTPLEGLIMGTRSGDIDPGLILHLLSIGLSAEEIDILLNRQSGLKGLSSLSSDMRELERAAGGGHQGAWLAIEAFCYRLRKYLGAYAAAMGGLDILVFTGGIGENATEIRRRCVTGLQFLGITLDNERNKQPISDKEPVVKISADTSPVEIVAVRTDEELMIAEETIRALSKNLHPHP